MRSVFKQLACLLVASFSLLAVSNSALAVVVWNEPVDGPLSNNRLDPTDIDLEQGVNTFIGTTVSGDREYFHVTIPAGQRLEKIILTSYVGVDGTAFIAVQEGTTFTEPPTGTDPANLLGWVHYGPGAGLGNGSDLLPDMGAADPAIGFTPPLEGEDYTFWNQQTGPNATTYQLDFHLVPEPASLGILLGMLVIGTMVIRKKQ